jgi:predicted DNA binding CopG/RHH family protein
MTYFAWNPEKNERLKQERGVGFEAVVFHIERGDLLDILQHPNQARYAGQRIFVVNIDNYAYLVPFVEGEGEVFLKTIIPSRKATNLYLRWRRGMARLDPEEQDLLDSFERGEWQSIEGRKEAFERYRAYARTTFKKDRRVNIRISSKDLEALQKRALEEGIPYQTLLASILHKYAAGRLVEKEA